MRNTAGRKKLNDCRKQAKNIRTFNEEQEKIETFCDRA